MKLNCVEAEEEIWDCSRLGLPLPPDVQNHVHECKRCAEAVEQVGMGLSMLRAIEHYPPAPDCRQQVLSELSIKPKAVVRRYAWAVAPAAFAVLLLTVFCQRNPAPYQERTEVKQPLKQTNVVHQHEPEVRKLKANAVLPDHPVNKTAVTAGNISSDVHQDKTVLHVIKPQVNYVKHKTWHNPSAGRNNVAAKTEITDPPAVTKDINTHLVLGAVPKPVPQPDDSLEPAPARQERIVQAVSVTWSAEPVGDLSYQYSDTDEATGTVTTGSVERNGDSIEIHLESVPVNDTSQPEKGMIEYEEKPSV